MRWQGRRRSTNVDDRRGRRGPKVAGGGLIFLILAAVVYFLGGDPTPLLQQGIQQQRSASSGGGGGGPISAEQQRLGEFASVILADTEDAWNRVFAQGNARYEPPVMVLFSDRVQSACGTQSAAVGPFYCPGDKQLYIDLSFFEVLDRRLGAPGDFAQAYVIAHEVGHHVQNLLGIDRAAHELGRGRSQAERNELSVLQELQADCFAGIWGHHASQQRDFLERGDLREGLNAAAAIGDDAIARQSGRVARPESFTHGSSDERVEWFRRGLEEGSVGACDTFGDAGIRLR